MSLDGSRDATSDADMAQIEAYLRGAHTYQPPPQSFAVGAGDLPLPTDVNTSNTSTPLLTYETYQGGPEGVAQGTYWRASSDGDPNDLTNMEEGIEDMLSKVKKNKGNVPCCQRPADLRYPITIMNPPVGCNGMVQPQPNPVSSKCAQVGWQYCYMCTCGFQFKVNNPEQAAICALCLKSPSQCICANSGQVYTPTGLEPQQTMRATKAGEYVRQTRNPDGYKCSGCGMAPKGTACICDKAKKRAKGGKVAKGAKKATKYASGDDDDEVLFDSPLVGSGPKRNSLSKQSKQLRKKQKITKKKLADSSDDDDSDDDDDDSDDEYAGEDDDEDDAEDAGDDVIEDAAMHKLLNLLDDSSITKWQATLKTAQELSNEYPSCGVDRMTKLIENAYNTIVTAGEPSAAKPSAPKPSGVAKPSAAKLSTAKSSAVKSGDSMAIVSGKYAGSSATLLSSNHAWLIVELADGSHVSVRKSECDLNHEVEEGLHETERADLRVPLKPSQDPEVRRAAGLPPNRSYMREAMGLRVAPAQTMSMQPPVTSKSKPKRKAPSTYLVYTLRAGIAMTGKKTLKSQLMKSPSGELSWLYDPDCQQQWTSYPGKYIPEYASGKHVYYDLDEAKAAVRDAAKKKKKFGCPIGITVEKRQRKNTGDETEPEDDDEDEAPVQTEPEDDYEAPVQQPKAAPKVLATPRAQSTGNVTEQPQTFTTDGKVYSTYEEAKAAADKAPKAMAIIRHASPEQYFVIPSMIADGSPVSTDSTITVDEIESVDLSGVTAAEVEAADVPSDAVADAAAASSSTHAASSSASSSTSSNGAAPSQYKCDECSDRVACCGCPDCKNYYCFYCIRNNSWVKEDTTDFQCPKCGLITP